MRILFSARPAFGHVFPLVPLALAAKERGHEVTFASGEAFLPRIASWGFATRNGVPAVVLPEGADRPYTAASLVESGAGIRLAPREATAADVAAAVRAVLDEASYRARAQERRTEIEAMPSPAAVVDLLEDLTR